LLNEEGQVSKAECTCTFFRKQGLKAGPCAHLVALRLACAEQGAKRGRAGGPRQGGTGEARTYRRRGAEGEGGGQGTLDRTRVKVRWGRGGQPQRLQVLRFNSADAARAAYFAKVEACETQGFLDATAG